MSKRTKRRYAICVDNSGYLASLALHKIYRVLPDAAAERGGDLRIMDDSGEHVRFDRDRFLLLDLPEDSNIDDELVPMKANQIMADALETEARLQEGGMSNRIGESYAATLKRIVETAPRYDDPISFALTFWECWVEAARNGWRVYATVAEADWPRFARGVARDVRRGILPDDPDLLDQLHPGDERIRPKWFRGLYGPNGRIDR